MARTVTTDQSLDGLVDALESTVPRYLAALRIAVEQAEGADRLTMRQFRCLRAIAAATDSATTSGLARSLRVAVPTMTRMLDGLVERGLAERRSNPENRRQVPVVLTPEGWAILARYEATIAARLRDLLAPLDPAARSRLHLALDDLRSLLDREEEARP